MPAARSVDVPFPERVGRYEVLLPIASGGMATVYLARAHGAGGFERDVALKLTHAHLRDSVDFAHELIEEGKLAVRIRHANVVPVLDLGDDVHGLFLVMDYIEGDTLSGLVRRAKVAGGALDLGVSLRILLDGLAGLHAAHELADVDGRPLNLVHRDFSPQNILVGVDGIGRLADFGIAKAASRLGATRTGLVKGKIGYMAPEQVRGQAVDRRCDVWAAGVLAWEMFARRQLFVAAADEIGLLFRIATEPPPRLSEVCEVPPAIDEAIARALSHDIALRTATADAFARELHDALRSSSIEVAEPGDVASVVKRLCAAKLSDRSARVKEVLRRRAARDTDGPNQAELATIPIGGPVSVKNLPSRTDVSAVASPSAMPAPMPPPPRSRVPVFAIGAIVATIFGGFLAKSLVLDAVSEGAAPTRGHELSVSAPPSADRERAAVAASASDRERGAPSAAPAGASVTVEPGDVAEPRAEANHAPAPAVATSARARPAVEAPKPPPSAVRPAKHHDSFLDDQY